MTLRRIVNEYQLRLGSSLVWPPYWINSADDPFWLDAPLAGKGSPLQLRRAAKSAADREKIAPQSAEEWRLLMRRLGLGVDCSGFVYHVLNDWLATLGHKRLADGLFTSRAEIDARNRRYPALLLRWNANGGPQIVPPFMSLGQAGQYWGLDMVSWCNVRRLVDPRAARVINDPRDLRPGDVIVTSKGQTDHIGVVLAKFVRHIMYADSAHEVGGLGGVKIRRIDIVYPGLGLEAQSWEQNHLYHPDEHRTMDGMWRINWVGEQVYGK